MTRGSEKTRGQTAVNWIKAIVAGIAIVGFVGGVSVTLLSTVFQTKADAQEFQIEQKQTDNEIVLEIRENHEEVMGKLQELGNADHALDKKIIKISTQLGIEG